MFDQLDISLLIPVGVFGVVAAVIWLVADMFSGKESRTSQRLDEIRNPPRGLRGTETQRDSGRDSRKSDAVTRVLERTTPTLAKPLQPKTEKDASKLKLRLAHAGFRSEAAPTMFLGMKFTCLMIGLVLGGGMVLFFNGMNQSGLFKAILVAGGMFYLPELFLILLGRNRKQRIFLGLPDALDLMVVCVEAGLGLDQAMRKVAEEMKKSYRQIAEEFGLCNLQLQMGRSRSQVLQELGQRSGVDDLRALASILIQADKFGSSIAQALRVQSDSMRTRRRQIAEEKAAKTAVKLIFPLVMFIFPGIFVVLVGPAAITMIREMLPAMAGP